MYIVSDWYLEQILEKKIPEKYTRNLYLEQIVLRLFF